MPVPMDIVYLAYQKLPSSNGEMKLFMVAYPRNATDAIVKTLAKAGLKPEALDLAPLALCRCANAPRAVIINSWLTFVDIIVMNEGLPLVIRSLSLPVDTVALDEKLPVIAEELNRTIAFYNSSYPESSLDSSVPVFVSGDLAEAPDKWQSLKGSMGLSVSALQPPMQLPEGFSPHKYMVNMGLALKGQLPHGAGDYYSIIDFNAMPKIYQPPAFSWMRVLVPVVFIVGIGALAWGGFYLKGMYEDTAELRDNVATKDSLLVLGNSKVRDLNAQKQEKTSQLETIQQTNTGLLDEIADWQEKIDVQLEANAEPIETEAKAQNIENMLAEITAGLDTIDNDLFEAVGLVPAGLNLLEIKYGDEYMELHGVADAESDALAFAQALRASDRFSMVVVSSITQTTRTEAEEEIIKYEFVLLVA
jgi:type IV pilus assembly protein PilM